MINMLGINFMVALQSSARRQWIYSSILDNVGDGNVMYTFIHMFIVIIHVFVYLLLIHIMMIYDHHMI